MEFKIGDAQHNGSPARRQRLGTEIRTSFSSYDLSRKEDLPPLDSWGKGKRKRAQNHKLTRLREK